MPFFTFSRSRIPANKKSRPPRLLFRRGRADSRGTTSICRSPAREGLVGIRCHTPGAVSGAPVFAYHLRFSKPLGKEFAAPAFTRLAPTGGSLNKAS